ncbi:putative lipopolysaccharide transport protein B: ATP-binding component of ABC superfamily [Pseudodesulfovibrio profundus]|uniref:Lipopolysaccharide export system ATP-binding protein LptB n=1 Tax=Pseudodesulfovibrio profundus TaxID=57320 RepID=A0A2C8F4C1_9BACT|nr:LPS export ABC transporter ATP-binding protein [Pseudodesulfovibrio profundus]MBC18370.1 LPS export ABC transporter ATP-binding protein [Desulfovibrio sp.]SOB57212.1 putative lipopolysaccharide transport protein B: ATP-binding component of ABC superfamily [Pseudodesulfovibrio profundus]|tara:strand:- start:16899 stop:17624 length:726 start_codon:yes stop_codon:yes gene_type:complete
MSQGLVAADLSKRYGQKEVVHSINLELNPQEVVGLLGPNGAGKTTTFYMLVGIVKPNTGRVTLRDEPLTNKPLHERARMGVSYLPQESSIFKKLSVRQNLEIILEQTALSRADQNARAQELMEMFRITKLADQPAMFLSGGERRRLEIARALIMNPKFILLDEPFAGIDPIAVIDIQEIISVLKSMGIGILISDHNVRETLNICDRAYLVYEGTVILEGTPEEIVEDSQARQIYLGEDFRL